MNRAGRNDKGFESRAYLSRVLTEDRVVDAVCRRLAEAGWAIEERAGLTDHGHDVVATKGDRRLIVEAKGAGSARSGSARFGQRFSSGQVFDHVAKAVLKALRALDSGHLGAVALPKDAHHLREIASVRKSLRAIGVGVLWVDEDGAVELSAPWRI